MWEALRKVHGAQGQGRLNFLKKKFFNYKAGAEETIDEISSELSQLQIIIQDITELEAPTDLDVALTLINYVESKAYTMAKYHLKDMRELILTHTKERLKLVEQKIKDNQVNDIANKSFLKGKGGRLCFHCDKPGRIKVKYYKQLATNKGKKYTKNNLLATVNNKKDNKATQANQDKDNQKRGRSKNPTKKKKSGNARTAQDDSHDEDNTESVQMAQEVDAPTAWIIDSGAS